jgi:hypothetical protein
VHQDDAWRSSDQLLRPAHPGRPHARGLRGIRNQRGGLDALLAVLRALADATQQGGISSLESRQLYLAGERGIAGEAEDLASSGVPAEDRAKVLFEMRNSLRTAARDAMADRRVAAQLNVTDPNMTWNQVIERYEARGFRGDDLWNAIAEASSRPRSSVNEQFGLEP